MVLGTYYQASLIGGVATGRFAVFAAGQYMNASRAIVQIERV